MKFPFEEFGFTRSAECLNGRLAMFAFAVSVIVELATGQGFLSFLQLI